MTAARLAEIRVAVVGLKRWSTLAFPQVPLIDELIAALETEMARLDWLIAWTLLDEDNRPPIIMLSVTGPEDEVREYRRECLRIAIEQDACEKGEPR